VYMAEYPNHLKTRTSRFGLENSKERYLVGPPGKQICDIFLDQKKRTKPLLLIMYMHGTYQNCSTWSMKSLGKSQWELIMQTLWRPGTGTMRILAIPPISARIDSETPSDTTCTTNHTRDARWITTSSNLQQVYNWAHKKHITTMTPTS
jgi:hypothetical protein